MERDECSFRIPQGTSGNLNGESGQANDILTDREHDVTDDLEGLENDEGARIELADQRLAHSVDLQYANVPPELAYNDWPDMARRPDPHQAKLERLPEVEEETNDELLENQRQHDYINYIAEEHSNPIPKQRVNSSALDLERQTYLLRDLLAIERANNEQRQQNNLAMKKYVHSLQADFLKLQSDLVQALEFGHKLKAQKESQISCLSENVLQKEIMIEQLQKKLGDLDEPKLRAEFDAALKKQHELNKLEQEQLRQQIATGEQQLCRERVNNSQLLQQFQEKIDDQLRLHERELATMKSRLTQSREDLERVLSEPQNLMIKALREDKLSLETQVEELGLALDENRSKYDSMRKRLELLQLDQERLAKQNQEELDSLQQTNANQRRALNELKLELEDKREVIQILDFNLQRSERRVKNLLSSLKEKENSYRELIEQASAKQRHDLDRMGADSECAAKRLAELEAELAAKQNELVRLRLEHESQLESLRNDRDERLNKLNLEKAALFRELQTIELRMARECETSNQRAKQIEQLHREAHQFREESKRLSLELTQSETKLYAKQQELQIAIKTLEEREAEQAIDVNARNKLDLVQRELAEQQNHSRKLKANIDELKRDNEKLGAKLRIAECNLDKTRSIVNREHEKMMREYEKKVELIRSEQASFDRNKLRYKRYGLKLKKYCEHLRRVHDHLCTPNVCGYAIGFNTSMTRSHQTGRQASRGADCVGLLDSDGDEQHSDSPYYDDISDNVENSPGLAQIKQHNSGSTSRLSQPNRFIIKRTGQPVPVAKNKCLPSRAPLRSTSTNPILRRDSRAIHDLSKSSDNLVPFNTAAPNRSMQPPKDQHIYYYIRDDHFTEHAKSLDTLGKGSLNKLTATRAASAANHVSQHQHQRQQAKRAAS